MLLPSSITRWYYVKGGLTLSLSDKVMLSDADANQPLYL